MTVFRSGLTAIAIIITLVTVAVIAQDPALPIPTALEACGVQTSLLNERIMALQAELTRLQVVMDRQYRTPPPREGYIWEWTLDPKTGQPIGYMKAAISATTPK